MSPVKVWVGLSIAVIALVVPRTTVPDSADAAQKTHVMYTPHRRAAPMKLQRPGGRICVREPSPPPGGKPGDDEDHVYITNCRPMLELHTLNPLHAVEIRPPGWPWDEDGDSYS
jgi:hypothetical protein